MASLTGAGWEASDATEPYVNAPIQMAVATKMCFIGAVQRNRHAHLEPAETTELVWWHARRLTRLSGVSGVSAVTRVTLANDARRRSRYLDPHALGEPGEPALGVGVAHRECHGAPAADDHDELLAARDRGVEQAALQQHVVLGRER